MSLNDIGLIVSLVMALFACIGVLWGFAYRWGGLNERIANIEEKLNLLYTVYVENALVTQYQSGNVSHSSPYRLTNQGQRVLIGITDLLTQSDLVTLKTNNQSSSQIFLSLVRVVGMDRIVEYCLDHEMTVAQFSALAIAAVNSTDDVT
ncbi:MAG: hypothetical protein FI692_06845 [SAR202 cluster bacterium]|mgnify:CR=1 FL=1|nr:hypothetical protein [SAR202 cluster bacterium]|tara:strand:- start:10796 stop:11242 length:447 start_codon:yes stop_codon:yes gene_type:complete